MFDDDGFFTYPETLATLDGVPEDAAVVYVLHADGSYVLLADVRAALDEARAAGEQELAELRAQHDTERAERDAEIERLDGKIRTREIDSALRAALAEAKCNPKMVAGALAALKATLDLVLTPKATEDGAFDGYTVAVRTVHGETSVAHAVTTFLATEGAAFAGHNATGEGELTAKMRALKRDLH